MARSLRLLFAALALVIIAAPLANAAVVAPDFNRAVRSMTIESPLPGDPAGQWAVSARVGVAGYTPDVVGQDLGLSVLVLVNGVVASSTPFSIINGGVGNCNCTSCPGADFCDNDPQFGCWCGVVVTPKNYFESTRIAGGDVVKVEIVAADGSLAEQFTQDDSLSEVASLPVPAKALPWGQIKLMYR